MKTESGEFNHIVEMVYNLPLEYKEELKDLLEHNLSDARREKIADNHKKALSEQKSGKLKFSSSVKELKNML